MWSGRALYEMVMEGKLSVNHAYLHHPLPCLTQLTPGLAFILTYEGSTYPGEDIFRRATEKKPQLRTSGTCSRSKACYVTRNSDIYESRDIHEYEFVRSCCFLARIWLKSPLSSLVLSHRALI